MIIINCKTANDVSANQFKCYQFEAGWQKNQKVNDVFYDIYVPPKSDSKLECQKAVLVLPGWKFSRSDWPEKSELLKIANQHQTILIMPEMFTTIYETEYFNETIMKWNAVAGGQFIRDQFLPALQNKGLLLKGYKNWAIGLSTGGRGVVMVHLQNPGIFIAGAAFSGDFDQALEPNDNLMRNVYGPYSQFKKRWTGVDNPVAEIERLKGENWTMRLYLSHGQNDRVVQPRHSEWLYNVIKKYKGADFPVIFYLVKSAGHDYKFWNSQLAPAFEFMEQDNFASK